MGEGDGPPLTVGVRAHLENSDAARPLRRLTADRPVSTAVDHLQPAQAAHLSRALQQVRRYEGG